MTRESGRPSFKERGHTLLMIGTGKALSERTRVPLHVCIYLGRKAFIDQRLDSRVREWRALLNFSRERIRALEQSLGLHKLIHVADSERCLCR